MFVEGYLNSLNRWYMIDNTPSSLLKYLLLSSCAKEFNANIIEMMNKLIIDAAKDNIFLMIITSNAIYNVTHENSKINYDRLIVLVTDFLKKKKS